MTRLVDNHIVHLCAHPECSRRTPPDRAFCAQHWRQLSANVQLLVYVSWDSRGIGEHLDYLAEVGRRLAHGSGKWPGWE